MKKKKFRKMLGILLCMTVLFTQAMPISFVYADENGGMEIGAEAGSGSSGGAPSENSSDAGLGSGEGAGGSSDSSESVDDSSTVEGTQGGNDENNGSDSVGGSGNAAGNSDADTDGTDSGDSIINEDDEAESGDSDGDDTDAGLMALEDEAVSTVDVSWYSAGSETKSASLSTAAQLRGLEALVNGTAVDSKGSAIAAETFSGWTITLANDIDLSADVTDTEWTPIGSSAAMSFKGTLDGNQHKISGMVITKRTTAYMGFFGYLGIGAVVKDLNLSGKIDVTTTTTSAEYVGGIAGYIDSSVLSGVSVNVELICTATMRDYIGGFAGYGSSCEADGCTAAGEVTVSTTKNTVYVGGMFGYLMRAQVTDCSSDAAVTAGSSSTNLYTGGISAYIASGTMIDSCVNRGYVTTGYSSVLSTTNYCGGITGYLSGASGSSTGTMIINSVNEGSISAAAKTNVYVGGLVGYTVNGVTVNNSCNKGAISAPDAASAAAVYAGGLVGCGTDSYMVVSNCYNAGNVGNTEAANANLNALAGGPVKGSVNACYAASGSCDSLLNIDSAGTAAGIGVFDAEGKVTAAEGYTLLYEGITDLDQLLNRWILSNVTSDADYCLWEKDASGNLMPTGEVVAGAAVPSVSVSASALMAAKGTPITLKAEISAPEHSQGTTSLSWQWYVSDFSTKKNPVALEGKGASGRTNELSKTIEYALDGDEISDKFYFVVVKNTVTFEDGGEIIGVTENEAESRALNIIVMEDYISGGYEGEVADSFEGGRGTAEDPYLISTPAQLKLMAEMVSDNTGRSAHYKLTADIDFGNLRWIPAGEYSSGARVFNGCLDGDGYTVSNLRIAGDGDHVGMFAQIGSGEIKNIRINGTLSAKDVTYVGGIAAYSSGSGCLTNVVSDIDITATGCTYVGGLAGYGNHISFSVYNCAALGDIAYQNTITESDGETAISPAMMYVGGLIGYLQNGQLRNSVNYGTLSGTLSEGYAGLIGYIENSRDASISICYAYSDDEESPVLINGGIKRTGKIGIIDSDGNVTAAEGYTLAYEDVTTLSELVNLWVFENVDAAGTYRSWIKDAESGVWVPAGRAISNASLPAVEVSASATAPVINSDAILTATITAEAEPEVDTEISYRWYVSDYGSGLNRTALEGENAGGVLEGTSGTVTYTINESEYSDRYYFIEVTRKVTHRDGENIIGTVETSSQSDLINIIFKLDDDTIYQGETADSFAEGSGTAEDPYLISTPSQLKLMAVKINDGSGTAQHYKLAADIDFNHMRWNPAGSADFKFAGSFDGDGHTVSNLKILPEGDYAGMFGYISGADIKNLTLEGTMAVNGIKYVGGIVGRMEDSTLTSLTNRMTIDAKNADCEGGIAGYATITSGHTNVIKDCVNNADITAHYEISGSSITYVYSGGLVGRFSANSNYGTASILNSSNTGNISVDGEGNTWLYLYAGGLVGGTGEGTSAVNLVNSSNSGNIKEEISQSRCRYMTGIAYVYLDKGSVQNCISTGSLSSSRPADALTALYEGLYVASIRSSTISDCYAKSEDGTKSFYIANPSGGMGTTPSVVKGLGYFDESGNLEAIDGYTLNYKRSDAVKAIMKPEYTDVFCALNSRASEMNKSESGMIYNSWVETENGLMPVGTPEQSPFNEVGVHITEDEYGEVFDYGAEIPTMKTFVLGDAAEDTQFIYEWYQSKKTDGKDRTLLTNTSEDPSEYTPSGQDSGVNWYSVDVTVVNGYHFTTVTSNTIELKIKSNGVWEGLVANLDELEGYGTEAYPYLITNGELLALVSEMMETNPSNKPEGEDSEIDADKIYQPFYKAYYEITNDIVMDGVHEFSTIGSTYNYTYGFRGHVFGKQKEDGTYPTISNLVINSSANSGTNGSSSYCGLFGYVMNGAEFKNFNIKDAKVTSSTTYTGILAGYVPNTLISNITVSGSMSGAGSYMGGIVGYALSSATPDTGGVIEYCTSEASITGSAGTTNNAGARNESGIGGIAGKITNRLTIRYCKNIGTIEGKNNIGGISGIVGDPLGGLDSGAKIIESCINTGTVKGTTQIGGITGYTKSGTIQSCYNKADVITISEGSSSSPVTAGGIVGYYPNAGNGIGGLYITSCYNTGTISNTSDAETKYLQLGGIASGCGLGTVDKEYLDESNYPNEAYRCTYLKDNYYLSDGSIKAVGLQKYRYLDGNQYVTAEYDQDLSAMKGLTADEMKAAATAVDLGDAYIIPSASSDGYPILAWEAADDEICTVTISSSDDSENAPSVLMQLGDNKVTSLRAQTGARFAVAAVSDSEGYRVTGVSQTVGGGEATALTANADGTYTISVSGDIVLTAETAANPYTVELKDSAQASDSDADGITYQAGDEVSIDVIVKSTKADETVDFAALHADVTFDPELLEYLGSSADSESADETAAESTVVSAGETAGSLLITRTSGSNTTVNNDGTVVVTLNFRVLNHISADEVETVADVSAAAGSQGSDLDLSDISQLVVPVSAVITLAPSQVVFLTDYMAAPKGYKLAAYRTALALEEGSALFYGRAAMIHASAFDGLKFVPAADDGETAETEGVNVSVGEASDEKVYTYVYFVTDETTAAEAIGNMKFGKGSCAEVDYEDYDITENAIVNIFDAQRVWDLFSFENFVDAVDFVSGPSMYQRLHADVNRDGNVNVFDALKIQRYLHFGEETDDSGETASEETPAA